jgi:hypothetical protein
MKNNYNTYPDNRDHLDCSKESSNPLQIVYDIYQDNRAHFDNSQKTLINFPDFQYLHYMRIERNWSAMNDHNRSTPKEKVTSSLC